MCIGIQTSCQCFIDRWIIYWWMVLTLQLHSDDYPRLLQDCFRQRTQIRLTSATLSSSTSSGQAYESIIEAKRYPSLPAKYHADYYRSNKRKLPGMNHESIKSVGRRYNSAEYW